MIEQPRRQTGPRQEQWFYHICSCGRLLEVVGGQVPRHTYTIAGFMGLPTSQWVCDRSDTPHSTTEKQ